MLTLYLCKEDAKKIRKFDPFFDKVQLDTDSILEIDTSKVEKEENLRGEDEIKTDKHPFEVESEAATLHLVKEDIRDPVLRQNRSFNVNPIQRTHIILVLAIPIDFQPKAFCAMIESFVGSISFIRLIYDNKDGFDSVKYSAVLYFKEEANAENFYQAFNGAKIGSNEESMLLLFLSKIIFTDDKTYATTELLFELSFELPSCPICIEKLDGSVTGIYFEAMNKVFHYEKAERWLKVKENCKVCSFLMNSKDDDIQCQQCGEKENVWICLICCHVGCGRYKSKHAQDHYDMTIHNFAIENESQRIWDYIGDTYVHRLMRSKDFIVLNLPDSEQRETGNDKFIEDRLDLLIWEYNFLLSNQLEEQRKFYDEQIAAKKQEYEACLKVKENEKILLDLKASEEKMGVAIAENEKEAKNFEKKTKMTKEKISNLLKEVDQLRVFNKSMESNLEEMSNMSQNNVSNELDTEIQAEELKLAQARERLELLFKGLE